METALVRVTLPAAALTAEDAESASMGQLLAAGQRLAEVHTGLQTFESLASAWQPLSCHASAS